MLPPSSAMSSTIVHNSYPLSSDIHSDSKDQSPNAPFMKGPKRKRLAKACDACHKSKRRCDGTAPCSNCFYASKTCTYTDASGRPVPAPRPSKPETQSPTDLTPPHRQPPFSQQQQSTVASGPSQSFYSQPSSSSSHQHHVAPNAYPKSGPSDLSEDEHNQPRKRFRTELGNVMPVDDGGVDGPIAGVTMERPVSVDLDPALTRELTNLFFTHCHPARAIIHKPTFTAALSHNRVPPFLLHAVCALAAPLSKQPRIRTLPARFAGKPFAQEALSLMFDGAGRLVCKSDLFSAQALCLLQVHDVLTKDKNMQWNSRYHDLALQIVESLGVHVPDIPTLTPMPSPEFIHQAIERESVRRIFWLIHFMDVNASILYKKPISYRESQLRLRLPADETSFELGVHSTLPEYLYLQPVRTQYASEFGHLIRVITIYAKVEYALNELNDGDPGPEVATVINDGEKLLEKWASSLSEHLQFSESSLQVQQSMFETSSNTGAWCYCYMHVYHAACSLALSVARHRLNRTQPNLPQWAISRLILILDILGDRARNSILMASVLWALVRYCHRDDEKVRGWCAEYEEAWGTRMAELASDRRSQLTPPLSHYHPMNMSSIANQRRGSVANIPRPPPNVDVSLSSRRKSSASPPVYPLIVPTGRHEDVRTHNPSMVPHGGSNFAGMNTNGGSRPSNGGSHYHAERERDNEIRAEHRHPSSAGSGSRVSGGLPPGSTIGSHDGAYTEREREKEMRRERESDHQSKPPVPSSTGSTQTLPSLKAVGLLDSLRMPLGDNTVQKQMHHSSSQQRSPRRTPPPSSSHPNDLGRPLGMPVGLPWLANESR